MGGGAYLFVFCLSIMTIDHASISRRSSAVGGGILMGPKLSDGRGPSTETFPIIFAICNPLSRVLLLRSAPGVVLKSVPIIM